MNFQQKYTFSFPTVIRFGAGVVAELGDYLKSQHLSKPLLVTDPLVRELDFFTKIISRLEQAGISVEVFSEVHKNPVKSDVLKGKKSYQETDRDSIIGIGGGVGLDVARAIALSINHHRDLFDYDDLIGGDQYVTEPIPHFVTIPTTAGTGSEVGRSAIISEDESKKKRILFAPSLMAKIVFADPELTMDLPAFVTAATGMDALTHNMEAYLSKNWHPMCSGIALEGIQLIGKSLEKATLRPDIESRSNMLMASMMGAVAFQKGLGVVHSLAHPLSSLLDTHHGLANAVNLPQGLAFNYGGSEEKFDQMALMLGLNKGEGSQLPVYIANLNARLGLPANLTSIGVLPSHIATLSDLAFADFCHPNNPKPVSQYDFEIMYTNAL
ncbi:iron-containing alcohol dehydrogenase [Cyclobacterium jeungdonense]|uniref:Iron-containing alcohol dehydrogenase n=1 Tax=Cyclobacterium jeungdonense TaxID=708087 RepID=A0ABT8CE42_9BACT|nr:iron-containing alcohol dehydrogenase [Cyclobacterium jeungdonense]MDN3689985.1 iron-containing alcohol dehydrogenase [Cyclobacterium jeungdonense]